MCWQTFRYHHRHHHHHHHNVESHHCSFSKYLQVYFDCASLPLSCFFFVSLQPDMDAKNSLQRLLVKKFARLEELVYVQRKAYAGLQSIVNFEDLAPLMKEYVWGLVFCSVLFCSVLFCSVFCSFVLFLFFCCWLFCSHAVSPNSQQISLHSIFVLLCPFVYCCMPPRYGSPGNFFQEFHRLLEENTVLRQREKRFAHAPLLKRRRVTAGAEGGSGSGGSSSAEQPNLVAQLMFSSFSLCSNAFLSRDARVRLS
jgi:hypothetical protein